MSSGIWEGGRGEGGGGGGDVVGYASGCAISSLRIDSTCQVVMDIHEAV